MIQETQIQKAIAIAIKDGFVQISTSEWYVRQGKKQVEHSRTMLLHLYTTDLNYLMPIAVKVLKELELEIDPDIKIAQWDLRITILALTIDTNNQYTELFEALFEAIKLLGDE
jgi:hypothetical protein